MKVSLNLTWNRFKLNNSAVLHDFKQNQQSCMELLPDTLVFVSTAQDVSEWR